MDKQNCFSSSGFKATLEFTVNEQSVEIQIVSVINLHIQVYVNKLVVSLKVNCGQSSDMMQQ